jgi:hypothetical protein
MPEEGEDMTATRSRKVRTHRRLGSRASWLALVGIAVALYVVAAAGAANPSANLDQCANDPLPSSHLDGCNSSATQWVNGNLGESKSVYFEGDSIPYRLTFGNLSTSGTHTVKIEWDTTKASKHAIDYIDTFNQSVADANPCLGVSGCNAATFTTFGIPADPQVTGGGVTPIAGNFRLYGGTITNVSSYTYSNGSGFTGDKSASIVISFNASVANPVLAWGGHIATRRDWGNANSAVAISGSPYHTRLLDLDGSGGNQDRSLSAAAVIFPGSLTVVKQVPGTSSTSFSYTGTPNPPITNFSLADDGTAGDNTKVFSNITTFQTYTVTEGTLPAGWGFDSAACVVDSTTANGGSTSTSGQQVSVNLTEGELWTCTYNNSLRTGTLTVIKHVINDNGGTKTAADFTLHVKSGTSDVSGSPAAGAESPGTSYTLSGGSYTVSENTPPSGYTQTGITGDCDSSGVVTVVAGQTKTCTITNDDQAANLTLTKHVSNTHGGTAVATDWTLTAGPNGVSGAGGASGAVSAGTYTLSESAGPSGYTAGSWSCTGGTFTAPDQIAVANGESASCDITNSDQAANLTLTKHVSNTHGGTAVATDWTLTAGPNGVSGAGGASGAVSAGTYTLSESAGPSGYTAGSWSCTGGTFTAPDQIAVANGESASCDITNSDVSPQLIVIKHVINDNGGTKVAADFTMNVTATNPSSSSFAGAESPGTTITLDAGSYSADETALSGYTKSLSADCSGTIAVGQTKTCTITNDDIPQVVAQITPTATTCQLFAAGTSATLDTLQYSLKGPGAGTINQVSPGVFFYWVKVTGGGSYTITQTVSQTGYVIPFASGSFVYDSSCTKLSSATVTQNTTSGTVTATFTGTGTFYIGIKYDPTALKGKAAPNPSTVTYTFATTGVAGSTQGLSLVKK